MKIFCLGKAFGQLFVRLLMDDFIFGYYKAFVSYGSF